MFTMVTEEVEEELGRSGEITKVIQDPKITKDLTQDPKNINDPDHFQDYGGLNLEITEDFNPEHHQDMITGVHKRVQVSRKIPKEMNQRREVNRKSL